MRWDAKEVCEGFEVYRDYPEDLLGYRWLLHQIQRRVPTAGGEQVILDYGCGPGKCSLRLALRGCGRVIGVDQSATMLEMARRLRAHPNIEYAPIHDDRLDLPAHSVDVAIACFVFINTESVERIRKAMSNIRRVLKPSGSFYILDTNPGTTGRRFSTFVSGSPDRRYEDGETRIVRLFRGGDECLRLEDYHWSKQVYLDCLEGAGFDQIEIFEPTLGDVPEDDREDFLAERGFDDWRDEVVCPPFIIFQAAAGARPNA